MQNGRVVEQGRHGDLMQRRGVYYQLNQAQVHNVMWIVATWHLLLLVQRAGLRVESARRWDYRCTVAVTIGAVVWSRIERYLGTWGVYEIYYEWMLQICTFTCAHRTTGCAQLHGVGFVCTALSVGFSVRFCSPMQHRQRDECQLHGSNTVARNGNRHGGGKIISAHLPWSFDPLSLLMADSCLIQ